MIAMAVPSAASAVSSRGKVPEGSSRGLAARVISTTAARHKKKHHKRGKKKTKKTRTTTTTAGSAAAAKALLDAYCSSVATSGFADATLFDNAMRPLLTRGVTDSALRTRDPSLAADT